MPGCSAIATLQQNTKVTSISLVQKFGKWWLQTFPSLRPMKYSLAWRSTPADSSAGGLARTFTSEWCSAGMNLDSCGITGSGAAAAQFSPDAARERQITEQMFPTLPSLDDASKKCCHQCDFLQSAYRVWPRLWTQGTQTRLWDSSSRCLLALTGTKIIGTHLNFYFYLESFISCR